MKQFLRGLMRIVLGLGLPMSIGYVWDITTHWNNHDPWFAHAFLWFVAGLGTLLAIGLLFSWIMDAGDDTPASERKDDGWIEYPEP